MSVDTSPPSLPYRSLPRPATELARDLRVDPRIPALVPGFDAPFFQAGLAGYSDAPMRLVARRHGCPYAVTEALLDRTLIAGGKGKKREDPGRLEAGADHPVAGQIMGSDPAEMAAAAAILVEMGYDTIDVNMACPVKKIRKANRGGHFLTVPDEAVAVLRAVRDAVPPGTPTSVKLRRAWDASAPMAEAFEQIFCAAYDIGYAWATVHCRTVEQKYEGPGRWEFLTELVARHPDKLIFGSGDIWAAEDVFAMLAITGVHAVSIARGAIGNPWIFRQCRELMAGRAAPRPTVAQQRAVLADHVQLSVELHGERMAARMMRKFGIKFSQHHPDPERVKAAFIRCKTLADWRAVLAAQYAAC